MNVTMPKEQLDTAESYRIPMPVSHLRLYPTTSYYICPRCGITLEWEFMSYCDRCGQCLDWKQYKTVIIVKK